MARDDRRMLELTGVEVRFAGGDGVWTRALDGLDLTIEAGELVALLGPSGSGKSTLLRVVAGLQPPSAGRVLLGGRDVTATPPHRRDVGMMFQDDALFPHRDVAGNIAFGLRMQGVRRHERRRRTDELLELVGLTGAGGRPVETLSGGEQQRVALARALAPRPRLLLLDEPLGSLDRTLRDRLVSELRALFQDLAVTVLSVTHDQDEAFAFADRVVVLDAGRLLQDGRPEEVWRTPASVRVARFLGFTNLAPARTVPGGLDTPWGTLPAAHQTDGDDHVLIRPDGIRRDAQGPLAARVVATTFRGDHVEVTLEVDGAPALVASWPQGADAHVGSVERVRIDPAAVVLLPP